MWKYLWLVIALCLPHVAQGDSLDQSFLGNGTLGAEINDAFFSVAQTFTAGISGDLTRIQIDLTSQPQHGMIGEISPFPINVDILSVLNGVPASHVLSSVLLPPGNYLLGTSIFFPQQAQVVAGKQYAIAVNYVGAPPLGLNLGQGSWGGTAEGDAYPEGAIFFSEDGKSWLANVGPGEPPGPGEDLAFQTYVQQTSEPSTPFLLVVGALTALIAKSSGLTGRR